jgi:hypothetical protein
VGNDSKNQPTGDPPRDGYRDRPGLVLEKQGEVDQISGKGIWKHLHLQVKIRADAPENAVATVAEESIGHRTVAQGVLGNCVGCSVLPPVYGEYPLRANPGGTPPVMGLISQ